MMMMMDKPGITRFILHILTLNCMHVLKRACLGHWGCLLYFGVQHGDDTGNVKRG